MLDFRSDNFFFFGYASRSTLYVCPPAKPDTLTPLQDAGILAP